MKDIIITEIKKPTRQGVTLVLNKKTSLKGGKGTEFTQFWVSWDKIGKALFKGYTQRQTVQALDKLRNKGRGV